jgi:hypothetical protein
VVDPVRPWLLLPRPDGLAGERRVERIGIRTAHDFERLGSELFWLLKAERTLVQIRARSIRCRQSGRPI